MNETRDEFLTNAQAAIDWFKAHPEMPTPTDLTFHIHSHRWGAAGQKAGLAAAMRALGSARKNAMSEIFWVHGEIAPGMEVRCYADRGEVCERIVTTDTLAAEPEQLVRVEAKPERTVERVSWKCPDSLLADAPQDQASELREKVLAGNGG